MTSLLAYRFFDSCLFSSVAIFDCSRKQKSRSFFSVSSALSVPSVLILGFSFDFQLSTVNLFRAPDIHG